jgi:hypothetical protein
LPNSNNVLLTKYLHQTPDIMVLSWLWAEHVSKFAVDSGYGYTELRDNPVTREQFQSALASKDPLFFHGLGHGNVDVFTGGMSGGVWSILLKASENPQDCKNRIIYLMSCDTAVELGPAIINAGGLAFSGYYYPYGTVELNVALNNLESAKYGRWHWGPMDQSSLIANGLLRGLTLADATAKAVARCNAWIDYFSRSGEPYADWQVGALVQNRDGLTNLGDVNAKLNPLISAKHTRAIYAIGYSGLIVCTGETFALNVGCSCQVDHCNFVGKSFSVKHLATGNIVYGTFTNFDRGLNWGSVQLISGQAGVVDVYEIRVGADANHDETVGATVTLPVQYIFAVICCDDASLNPISQAAVAANAAQGTTNDQGVFYYTEHTTNVHVTINAEGYEPVDMQFQTSGAPEEVWHFYLRKTVRPVKIKGMVKTRSGTPIPSAQVLVGGSAVSLGNDTPHTAYAASTDSEGNFEIPDFLPKDRYGVLVIKQGARGAGEVMYEPYIGYIDCLADGENIFGFFLDEAPPLDQNLFVQYVAGIARDTVAGCVVPNTEVMVNSPPGRYVPTVTIKSNEFGFYVAKITVALSGSWSYDMFFGFITKSSPQFLPSPPIDTGGWRHPNYMGSVFSIIIPVWRRLDYCLIHLGKLDCDNYLPMLFLFSGFVKNTSLSPIPNATVTITATCINTGFPTYTCQAATNELGYFELTVLKVSTYQGAITPYSPYQFSITVESGDQKYTKDLDIFLPVGTRFNIMLSSPQPPPTTYTLAIVSGPGGTTLPAPGTHTLNAGTEQLATAIQDTNYRFVRWSLDGQMRTENPIAVLMNTNHTLSAEFEYVPPPPSPATITGTVTDRETGEILAGVIVTTDGYANVTEINGQYSLPNMPPKAYTLTFTKEGYNTLTVDVDASSGGTFTQDVSMEPVAPPTAPPTIFDRAWAAFTEFSGRLKLPVPPKPSQPPKLPIEE